MDPTMPNKIEAKTIVTAKHYLEVRGYIVEDVSESAERNEYNLKARRDAEELRIKVKGLNRLWNISDLGRQPSFSELKRRAAMMHDEVQQSNWHGHAASRYLYFGNL